MKKSELWFSVFANCGTVERKLFPEVKQVKHVKLETSTLWPFPAAHPLCPHSLSISQNTG